MICLQPDNRNFGKSLARYTLTAKDAQNRSLDFYEIGTTTNLGSSITLNDAGMATKSYELKYNGVTATYALVTATRSGYPTFSWKLSDSTEAVVNSGKLVNGDNQEVWNANSSRNYKLNYQDLANKPNISLWAESSVDNVSVTSATFSYAVGNFVKHISLTSTLVNPVVTLSVSRAGQHLVAFNAGTYPIKVKGDGADSITAELLQGESVTLISNGLNKSFVVGTGSDIELISTDTTLNTTYAIRHPVGTIFYLYTPYVSGATAPSVTYTDDAGVTTTFTPTYGRLYACTSLGNSRFAMTCFSDRFNNDTTTNGMELVSASQDWSANETIAQRIASRHSVGVPFVVVNTTNNVVEITFPCYLGGSVTAQIAAGKMLTMVMTTYSTQAIGCRYSYNLA